MTPTETAALLRRYNEWRRGNLEGQPMPDPREIGEAIDAAIEMIDRLEAAEKAVAEAYQRGYSTGREEIEKERDALRAKNAGLVDDMNLLRDNNASLRARIEEMEKQEPVAEWVDSTFDQYPYLRWREPYKAIAGAKLYTKFYALPGAKGEEK